MPINAADARQLCQVMLDSYAEDYDVIGKILLPLRQRWPTIDWMAELTTQAQSHQPFIDGGLSVAWWLAEVDRRSTP